MNLLTKKRWHQNGQPTTCMYDACAQTFQGSCFHAPDGRYYCDESCFMEADNSGLRRIEKLARLQ